MNSRTIWISGATCVLGFVAGFMFANTLNRSEITAAKPSADAQATQAPDQPRGSQTLAPDEIKSKVADADRKPDDFVYQKNLGLSLYRYASLKQDASILPDAIRIMERGLALDSADRDLQIGLGNAYFDKGYFNKDNASFDTARKFYNQALSRVSSDIDVRTDLALTYFLQEPPDLKTAVAEFEKGLAINPKHERSLQFLAQTYVKQNEIVKASETVDRLKAANPSSPAIGELMTLIAGGNPPAAK